MSLLYGKIWLLTCFLLWCQDMELTAFKISTLFFFFGGGGGDIPKFKIRDDLFLYPVLEQAGTITKDKYFGLLLLCVSIKALTCDTNWTALPTTCSPAELWWAEQLLCVEGAKPGTKMKKSWQVTLTPSLPQPINLLSWKKSTPKLANLHFSGLKINLLSTLHILRWKCQHAGEKEATGFQSLPFIPKHICTSMQSSEGVKHNEHKHTHIHIHTHTHTQRKKDNVSSKH